MKFSKNIALSIFLLVFFYNTARSNQILLTTATIEGIMPQVANGDTIILKVWDSYIKGRRADFVKSGPMENYSKANIYSTTVEGGKFYFKVPLTQKLQYFFLESKKLRDKLKNVSKEELLKDPGLKDFIKKKSIVNLSFMMIEPGDQLKLALKKGVMKIDGKGAAKNQFLYTIEYELKKDKHAPKRKINYITTTEASVKEYLNYKKALINYKLKKITKYRKNLSETAYKILYTDVVAEETLDMYHAASMYFNLGDKYKEEEKRLVNLYVLEFYKKPFVLKNVIANEYLGLSAAYAKYIVGRLKSDAAYEEKINGQVAENNSVSYAKNNCKGLLKDKILYLEAINLVSGKSVSQNSLEDSFSIIIASIQTPFLKNTVINLSNDFKHGTEMEFTMYDTTGKEVRLSDFRGKVVFLDLWFTGCGACRYVAEGMQYVEKAFQGNNDIVFISISVDKDKETWLQSIKKDAEKSAKFRFAGRYYSGSNIYLYTGGRGTDIEFVKKYVPDNGYPQLLVIDEKGNLHTANPPRPWKTIESYEILINFLKNVIQEKTGEA